MPPLIYFSIAVRNHQMCEEVGSDTATLGMLCLTLSLVCDGITGGTQDSMNKGYKEANNGKKLKVKK